MYLEFQKAPCTLHKQAYLHEAHIDFSDNKQIEQVIKFMYQHISWQYMIYHKSHDNEEHHGLTKHYKVNHNKSLVVDREMFLKLDTLSAHFSSFMSHCP